MNKIPIIGLIGGVGSGKTYVAHLLQHNLKQNKQTIVVIDGDLVGHNVLKQKSIKEQLRSQFGDSIFDSESGEIDRKKLGAKVWGSDSKHRAARRNLEAIVHPEIRNSFLKTIDEARTQNQAEAIILDAAVLLESGWKKMCDAIVFIETSLEDRLERVQKSRGWSRQELIQREKSQLSLEQKKEEADFVIQNNTQQTVDGEANAGQQLEQILNQLKSPSLTSITKKTTQ